MSAIARAFSLIRAARDRNRRLGLGAGAFKVEAAIAHLDGVAAQYPIRSMQRVTPVRVLSFGKVKIIAAALLTRSRKAGFGFRLSALAYSSFLKLPPNSPARVPWPVDVTDGWCWRQ